MAHDQQGGIRSGRHTEEKRPTFNAQRPTLNEEKLVAFRLTPSTYRQPLNSTLDVRRWTLDVSLSNEIPHLQEYGPNGQRSRIRPLDNINRLVGSVHGRRSDRAHAQGV